MDELSGDACTTQLLNPGPWCERLPHFRLDQVPASGEEIQSEYMVDRSQAVDAIRALRAFEPEMRESMMIAAIGPPCHWPVPLPRSNSGRISHSMVTLSFAGSASVTLRPRKAMNGE